MRSVMQLGATCSGHYGLDCLLCRCRCRSSMKCRIRGGTVVRRISQIAISLILLIVAGAAQAGTEDDVRALFTKYVAAQNAHDIKAVGELLQDSPNFLWITRGTPIWGRDAALKRFETLYQGTWSLDPKTDELKVIELQPGVAQLYVPVTFMIAPPARLRNRHASS